MLLCSGLRESRSHPEGQRKVRDHVHVHVHACAAERMVGTLTFCCSNYSIAQLSLYHPSSC